MGNSNDCIHLEPNWSTMVRMWSVPFWVLRKGGVGRFYRGLHQWVWVLGGAEEWGLVIPSRHWSPSFAFSLLYHLTVVLSSVKFFIHQLYQKQRIFSITSPYDASLSIHRRHYFHHNTILDGYLTFRNN